MSTLTVYQTPPQKERKAQAELERLGVTSVVPMTTVFPRVRHHTKRRATVTRDIPTAPRYLFTDPGHAYERHTLPSGITLSRIGSAASADVDRLDLRRTQPYAPVERFKPGDRVRITGGPFSGHTATVDGPRGTGWRVTASLFGRPCPLALADNYVEAA